MRFGRIKIRNFRSFMEASVNLGELRQACVSGDNGAGKSTLVVDAPLWALFGKAHADLDSVVGPFGETAEVSLEVMTQEGVFIVTRTRKRAGTSGLTVKAVAEGDEPLRPIAAGVAPAQAYIEEHLLRGRSYRELVSSVYMVQGRHSEFTRATQAEAKEVFIRLLALDRWTERAAHVAKLRREAEVIVASLERDVNVDAVQAPDPRTIAELDTSMQALEAEVDDIVKTRAAIDAQLMSAAKANESHDRIAAGIDQARAEEAAASKALLDAKRALDAVRDAPSVSVMVNEVDAHEDAKETHDEWAEKYQALAQQVHEIEIVEIPDLMRKIAVKQTDLETLESGGLLPTCYTCGQPITDNDKGTELLRDARRTIDDLKMQVTKAQDMLNELNRSKVGLGAEPKYDAAAHVKASRDYENAKARVQLEAMYESALSVHDAKDQRLTEMSHELQQAEHVDTSKLKAGLVAIDEDMRSKRALLSSARGEHSTLVAAAARAEEQAGRLAANRKALEEATTELEQYVFAERAFGRDGIPAYLMDAAIPQVEKTTNELLSLMSGDSLRVRLDTQRYTKTAGTKDVLDIVVSDGVSERPFSTFSGGEGFRINFALRVALAEVVAQRSGLSLSMLVIDEPEGLDAGGRDALVQALSVIEARFDTIVLVSHHEDLREALPEQVMVRKGLHGSTVSTGE